MGTTGERGTVGGCGAVECIVRDMARTPVGAAMGVHKDVARNL